MVKNLCHIHHESRIHQKLSVIIKFPVKFVIELFITLSFLLFDDFYLNVALKILAINVNKWGYINREELSLFLFCLSRN